MFPRHKRRVMFFGTTGGQPYAAANVNPIARPTIPRERQNPMNTNKKTAKKPIAKTRSAAVPVDTPEDKVLADLLKRLKETADPKEISRLSDQIERVIFLK
jgi:hypothetical protein